MAVVSMNNLLEAGVHFGHQTKRWNPKMKPYIFTARDDIYIIDLEKTVECIEKAYAEIKKISENGGKFIFVGTKKQAGEVARDEALRSQSYYVSERWLGGTLTNFKTIRRSVRKLDEIEKMEKDGRFELLPKKEVILIKKEYDKLNKVLCGIRDMEKVPDAMIVVDPKKELNAIREARKLGIPVFGLVDTNCDPDDVDYVIPANDDAVRSVAVVLGVLSNAICEGKNLPLVDYVSEIEKPKMPKKENKPEDRKEEKNDRKKNKPKKEKDSKEVEKVETQKKPEEPVKEEVKEKEIKIEEKKEEPVKEEVSLDEMTLADLKKEAKSRGLTGYSTMKKGELLEALKN